MGLNNLVNDVKVEPKEASEHTTQPLTDGKAAGAEEGKENGKKREKKALAIKATTEGGKVKSMAGSTSMSHLSNYENQTINIADSSLSRPNRHQDTSPKDQSIFENVLIQEAVDVEWRKTVYGKKHRSLVYYCILLATATLVGILRTGVRGEQYMLYKGLSQLVLHRQYGVAPTKGGGGGTLVDADENSCHDEAVSLEG